MLLNGKTEQQDVAGVSHDDSDDADSMRDEGRARNRPKRSALVF